MIRTGVWGISYYVLITRSAQNPVLIIASRSLRGGQENLGFRGFRVPGQQHGSRTFSGG